MVETANFRETPKRNRNPEPAVLARPAIDLTRWQEAAACKDADVNAFFGPDREQKASRQRRERHTIADFCLKCPVRDACLEHAQTVPEPYGVWGGLGEDDRRRLLRRVRRQKEKRN